MQMRMFINQTKMNWLQRNVCARSYKCLHFCKTWSWHAQQFRKLRFVKKCSAKEICNSRVFARGACNVCARTHCFIFMCLSRFQLVYLQIFLLFLQQFHWLLFFLLRLIAPIAKNRFF